ncbi:MAG: GIY-YIG nuclease family protein [Spirosomataceae bacterium]
MEFTTYILYSASTDRYYVGSTGNLPDRLLRHNQGRSKATKSGLPWVVVHREVYPSRSAAYRRELEIKGKKSRKYIESLLHDYS